MNAVIYGRVSTADKQDYGRQVYDLERYAKNNGYKIVKTFTEKITGTREDRQEFNKMLTFVEEQKIGAILVTELSRFGRIGVKTRLAVEELAEKGIDVYFNDRGLHTVIKGKINTDAMMIVGLLADLAKKELETLKERIKSGLRYSVANNGAGASAIKPYGYTSVNKKLVIDPTEAKIVRIMFEKYLSGLGTQQLAGWLHDNNIPTKFNKVYNGKTIKTKYGYKKDGSKYVWRDKTVYGILKNTIYIGQRKHKDEIFSIDPIIEPEIFARVQDKLKNKFNKLPMKHFDLLRGGLLKCGRCGKNYYLHERSPKNGKPSHDKAYKCISGRYPKEWCANHSIGKDKLLTALQIMCRSIIMHESIEQKINAKDTILKMFETKETEINGVKSRIKSIRESMNDIIKMRINKEIDAEQFTSFKTELDKELTKKEDLLKRLSTEYDRLNQTHKKRSKIPEYTVDIFKTYFSHYVEYVKIYTVENNAVLKHFTEANEAVVLIEVKPLLSNKLTHFVISRRTNVLMFIAMNDPKKDSTHQIMKNQYHIAMVGKTKPFVTINKILNFSE